MARFTPPLHAKGIYTLTAPFPDITSFVYECTAIRSFSDFIVKGEDVYTLYYQTNGLSSGDYDSDLAEGACIVTLSSPDKPTIFVPDTYIAKYPDLEYVRYSNIVVSAALGAIPDELDLTLMKAAIATVISEVIGVTPTVAVHKYGSAGVVSTAQHAINEGTRTSAITNLNTDHAKLLACQTEKIALEARVLALEDVINTIENP